MLVITVITGLTPSPRGLWEGGWMPIPLASHRCGCAQVVTLALGTTQIYKSHRCWGKVYVHTLIISDWPNSAVSGQRLSHLHFTASLICREHPLPHFAAKETDSELRNASLNCISGVSTGARDPDWDQSQCFWGLGRCLGVKCMLNRREMNECLTRGASQSQV